MEFVKKKLILTSLTPLVPAPQERWYAFKKILVKAETLSECVWPLCGADN